MPEPTNPTESMRRVIDETKRVVANVRPDQLDDATPCADWDVRALLNHVTGGATMFAECVEHGSIADDEMARLMTEDLVGDSYKSTFNAAADRAVAAFDEPGALDRMVKLPFGEMPAAAALQIAVFDVTVHALDLAAATGQSRDIDPEVLETAWVTAQSMLTDDMRATGMFAAAQPCPADASRADQLLAFAGRTI
jgi:uncharacterized protein (TIGR03086 family)